MNTPLIRKARREDAPRILELIKELAQYEKAPQEVTNTVEQILEDGFGENPAFTCGLAEYDGQIAGLYLWYTRYSTWKGKGVYLEDIIVSEAFRGKGLGRALLNACIADAQACNAAFITWQVLDWNTPAIEFYKSFGASFDETWINVKLNRDQIASYTF